MRNKLYVCIVLVPAALLAWGAIHLAMGGSGLFWVVPAGLAVALCVVAVRVAQADSFAPAGKPNHDRALSANVKRWLKVQDHDDASTKSDASRIRR